MLIIIGFVIVFVSSMGGFVLAGGNPMVLLHLSEFVIIGGVSLGILIISTPQKVLMKLMSEIIGAFSGGGVKKKDIEELFKVLYELFMLGRRNGLLALDEHISDLKGSTIFGKYPGFLKDEQKAQFLVNSLRPVIDGKIKPEQLADVINKEIHAMEEEAHEPISVMVLVGDSLPGVGIVAAVLGIINTMGSISAGPDAVGYKVAAALTGTFLGIFAAYGFINPLGRNLEFRMATEMAYYKAMSGSVVGFTKGLAPLMALEIARRGLPEELKLDAEGMEESLKEIK